MPGMGEGAEKRTGSRRRRRKTDYKNYFQQI
jgi:hypothetical protein